MLDRFNDLTVLIVGDVMIDAYLWGNVDRISPEAPVPVVHMTSREDRLGGAGNVALNTHALGASSLICSVISDDAKGEEFIRLLEQNDLPDKGMVRSHHRHTTVKTRVISNGQQMVRVDEETTTDLQPEEEQTLLDKIRQMTEEEKVDVIIFEDYNKGVLTPTVIRETIALANEKGIPTAVDPKSKNFFAYEAVTLFKPNLKELREGLGMIIDPSDDDSLRKAEEALREKLHHHTTLITLSSAGIYVRNEKEHQRIPAHIRNISDVSGAGDTVISVAALCLALGIPERTMALMANLAGGSVCEKVGVVPVDKEQLLREATSLKEFR